MANNNEIDLDKKIRELIDQYKLKPSQMQEVRSIQLDILRKKGYLKKDKFPNGVEFRQAYLTALNLYIKTELDKK